MRTATASKITATQTHIGHELARQGVDMILSIEDCGVLIQCQVSSAIAAAMLAPLGGEAVGQFRPLAGNIVEIDAAVSLAVAQEMLQARQDALAASARLH